MAEIVQLLDDAKKTIGIENFPDLTVIVDIILCKFHWKSEICWLIFSC